MTDVDLPQGWAMAQVGALGDFINGMAFKPTDWGETGTPIIRIQNLTDPDRPINLTEREVDEKYVVEHGDILVSWSASLDAFKWHGSRAYVNQHIFKVVPNPGLDPGFVFYALKKSIKELISSEHLHGSTMKHINRRPFLAHPCALPPLNEQQRIVEKIETLFAELDKGEESLRQVQTLLARYRQSVLKAAVTGELTADWRAERAGKFEHGRDLLERILQTRRKTWEGRGRYSEPSAPKSGDLPELPEGWVWTTVEQLLRAGLSNGRSVPDAQEGFPVLRLTALKDGWIDLSERKIGAWEEESARGFLIQSGDILVSRGNGSKRLVGRGGLVLDEPDPVAYPDTMIKVPLLLDHISADWFVQLWNSPFMREQIEKAAKTTAGIYKINQTDIRSFKVPLPSLEEQLLIAEKVGETSEALAALESQCGKELSRSAALRQSILKDAFSGRLVPQNPNGEPASELLARIRRSQEAGRAAKQMK